MINRDEEGFTLVEVLLAATIILLVVGTVATALGLYFSTVEETTDRLAESPEVQIASVYLTRDVQSAEYADTDVTTAKKCAQSSWGGTHLVSFGWRDPGTSTQVVGFDTDYVVSYVVSAASGNPAQKELRRYECTALVTLPGQAFPLSLATARESQTLIALVDPSVPATANVTSSTVTTSLKICTAKTGTAECKSGVSLPFDLTVTRRAA